MPSPESPANRTTTCEICSGAAGRLDRSSVSVIGHLHCEGRHRCPSDSWSRLSRPDASASARHRPARPPGRPPPADRGARRTGSAPSTVLSAGVRKNRLLTFAAAWCCSSHSMISTAAMESTTTAHASANTDRAGDREVEVLVHHAHRRASTAADASVLHHRAAQQRHVRCRGDAAPACRRSCPAR